MRVIGIDVGSTTTKCGIIASGSLVLLESIPTPPVTTTGSYVEQDAKELLDSITSLLVTHTSSDD